MTEKENSFKFNLQNDIDLLKSKITCYCLMAAIDHWNMNEAIYISYKKNDTLYMNNPHLKCDKTSVDNLLDINMAAINIDMFRDNIAEFLLHFIIHNQETSNSCVVFVDCSSMTEKLLKVGGLHPISQESILIGGKDICIFDYEVFCRDLSFNMKDEDMLNSFLINQGKLISEGLQKNNKLFLKNRGFLALGCSIEQCWYVAYQMLYAIDTQVKLVDIIESDSIIVPSLAVQNEVRTSDLKGHSRQIYMNSQSVVPNISDGELEFEANTRYLENLGLKTRCNERHAKIWNNNYNPQET